MSEWLVQSIYMKAIYIRELLVTFLQYNKGICFWTILHGPRTKSNVMHKDELSSVLSFPIVYNTLESK